MANLIAIVKLAPGEVGYYDELTRTHLTLGRPSANIYDYMNTSRLRRSVMSKTLMLVAGSLNPTSYSMNIEEDVVVEKTPVVTKQEVAKEKEVVTLIEEIQVPETIETVEEIKTEVKAEVEETKIEVKEITSTKANSKKKKKED